MVLSPPPPLLSIHIKNNVVSGCIFFRKEVFKENTGFQVINSGPGPICPRHQIHLFLLEARALQLHKSDSASSDTIVTDSLQ